MLAEGQLDLYSCFWDVVITIFLLLLISSEVSLLQIFRKACNLHRFSVVICNNGRPTVVEYDHDCIFECMHAPKGPNHDAQF